MEVEMSDMRDDAMEGVMLVRCGNRAGVEKWGKDANSGLPGNFIKTSKYEWWNFVVLNLWLQFQKVANLYFLANMCFALIPGVSPVFPVTTITPLVAVVGVSATRDAYEDYKRHKEDSKANSVPVQVLRAGSDSFTTVKSAEVKAGDIVRLHTDMQIPADILLLSTTREDDGCYIETANLDGESNLKKKTPLMSTVGCIDVESLHGADLSMECDAPSPQLSSWSGTMTWGGARHPANLENILLRGCVLRETPAAFGFVVYTGVNTKMFLNLTPPPIKKSRIDTKLEKLILKILAGQQIIILILCGVSLHFAKGSSQADAFYIEYFNNEHSSVIYFVTHYLTYFVLLSLMMPISLFLSIEFCKTLQAQFMEWDLRMYDPDRDLAMKAQTASLNEELSQVQVICTDKTGTLTDNKMVFAKAVCGGVIYDELAHPGAMGEGLASNVELDRMLQHFAICNTVIPSRDEDSNTMQYAGDSTDEVALVKAAASNGYLLTERKEDHLILTVPTGEVRIEILAVLPFSSDRKMMSMVVRHPTLGLALFNKGADASVVANLDKTKTDAKKLSFVNRSLDDFACDGLRTLCMGFKQLTEAEYDEWRNVWWEKAVTSVANRADRIEEACLKLETGLELVGATGIEDKLQEQVPETIQFFRSAGVVVFVLTGDKRETAINIAKSCNLIKPNTNVIMLNHETARGRDVADYLHAEIQSAVDTINGMGCGSPLGSPLSYGTPSFKSTDSLKPVENCVVVDGHTLGIIQENSWEMFQVLLNMVHCALCCRVTPMQKADVVHVMQSSGVTCLAVGDGANDVSMIQQAKVGVGVMGLEGSQAERSSDYAIPRFKHLIPLLAIHGRYSLLKNSYLIQYSFYKNLVYSLCQMLYSFVSGFTGQTIFDSWVIICYNMLFTLLPPLAMGLFEYDVTEHEVYKYPLLYYDLRSPIGGRLSKYSIVRWFSWAVVHSAIIFGFMVPTMQRDDVALERSSGIWTHGSYVMSFVVTAVLAKSALLFMSWTWLHFASIVLSLAGYHLFIVCYSSIPMFLSHSEYYGIYKIMYSDPKYWLLTVAVVTLIIILEVAVVYWAKEIDPRLVDLVRESMHMRKQGLRRKKGGVSQLPSQGKKSESRETTDGDRSKPLLGEQFPPGGSPLLALRNPPSPGLLPSRRRHDDPDHVEASSLESPTHAMKVNFAQLTSSRCSMNSLRSASPCHSQNGHKQPLKPKPHHTSPLPNASMDTSRLVSQISLLEFIDEELEKNNGRSPSPPAKTGKMGYDDL